MAPEQQNYIEKAKLNDTQELEKSILDSPQDFDEKKVRDFYKKKLNEAVGGATLTGPLLQKYREAQQKIDENIQKFIDIRDYAKARMAILGEPLKFGEKVVVQGGVEAYLKSVPKITHNVEHFLHTKYLADIDNLLNNPPKSLTAYMEFSTKDRAKFGKIRETIVAHLEEYYKEMYTKGGQAELDKVKAGVSAGRVSLVEYMDLDNQMDNLMDIFNDKAPGAKDGIGVMDKIWDRIKLMRSNLQIALQFLPESDRKAVEAFNASSKAKQNKEKGADKAYEKASEYLYMIDNRQRAEKNRTQLLAYGGDAATLAEGTEYFEKAKKAERNNYFVANEFYMKARDKYAESRDIYLAEQKKKKSGSKPA